MREVRAAPARHVRLADLIRAVAQLGRAPGSGPGGRGFKSHQPDLVIGNPKHPPSHRYGEAGEYRNPKQARMKNTDVQIWFANGLLSFLLKFCHSDCFDNSNFGFRILVRLLFARISDLDDVALLASSTEIK